MTRTNNEENILDESGSVFCHLIDFVSGSVATTSGNHQNWRSLRRHGHSSGNCFQVKNIIFSKRWVRFCVQKKFEKAFELFSRIDIFYIAIGVLI